MKENYDFSKGKKNPYADKVRNGYSVMIHYGAAESRSEEDPPEHKDPTNVATGVSDDTVRQ